MSAVEDKTRKPGTVHRAKARKQWDCAECADPIVKGQTYMYLNTFDEHSRTWSRYVLCRECERILNCHRVVEVAFNSMDEFSRESTIPYTAGQLRAEVKRLIKTDPAYKKEFHLAWEASEGAPV